MWSWIRQIAVVRSSDLNAIARIFINLYRVYYKLKDVIKKSMRKIVNSIAIRFHSLHQRLNCYIFSVSSKRSIRYKLKVVSVVFFVLNALTMSNRSNIIWFSYLLVQVNPPFSWTELARKQWQLANVGWQLEPCRYKINLPTNTARLTTHRSPLIHSFHEKDTGSWLCLWKTDANKRIYHINIELDCIDLR